MPDIALTQASAHLRHGSNIGQPLTRRDGVLKVTGGARYAADNHPPGMLHAVLAASSIARGRVTFLDVPAAKAHPGVVEVMTPANKPPLAQDPDAKENPFMFRLDLLQNNHVRYANQPIAVVIAESLEAAAEGAALLSPRYEAEPPRIGLDTGESFIPPGVGVGSPAEMHRGDVEAGLAVASRRIDATYETAAQYHNAMEPHAIVAAWDGDSLSIDTPSQGLAMGQGRAAGLFGIPPENIHIRSPFLGGGFGSKGLMSGPQVLGIMAARLVGRPVKLVLRREQMFGPVGHRAPTRQRVRMGADRDGVLTAIDHHTKTTSSTFDDFFEPASDVSHTLYASPAIATSYEAARHGDAALHACPRRGDRLDRARERDRRDGAGLRDGSARVPSQELRRGGTDFRQAVLLKGLARLLRSRRRALWLGAAPARAAADARRGQAPCRLGHRHRDLSGDNVPGSCPGGYPE
jgi:xanthine dehydrogenase YagR molybdenum-binding subunit